MAKIANAVTGKKGIIAIILTFIIGGLTAIAQNPEVIPF